MCSGALFGSLDIQLMSDTGKLSALRVVMKKHPLSLYPKEGTPQHALNEQAKVGARGLLLSPLPVRRV